MPFLVYFARFSRAPGLITSYAWNITKKAELSAASKLLLTSDGNARRRKQTVVEKAQQKIWVGNIVQDLSTILHEILAML